MLVVSNAQWQHELRTSFSSVSDLFKHNLITSKEAQELSKVGESYQVRITPYYARLMSPDPACPIRKQAVPALGELDPVLPSWATELSQRVYGRSCPWTPDPIGDLVHLSSPRITHRYLNRAILHVSSTCAVYCRFCFRKSHLNEKEEELYLGPLEPAFEYLRTHEEISEVILTGGDPLSVSDKVLLKLLDRLNQIPHLRVVRIHSRMLVTLPMRFTSECLEILSRSSLSVVLVSHFNHPKELTSEVASAVRGLKQSGITLLNQSVLLRGVNDSVETLGSLFQGLYEMGVIPFYLHYPDWTPGTFQFRPGVRRAQEIVTQLKGRVSGPALPELVLDIPGGYGKIPLLDSRVQLLEILDKSETNSSIQGALYRLPIPHTRRASQSGGGPLLTREYLDLFI